MDYSALITRGTIIKPMRNTFYGVEKIGKSTLAAYFPNPITISAEDGTNHIDTARYVPQNWADVIGFLSYLYNTADHGYQTLNIDTAGWVEEMAASALCLSHGVDSLEKVDGGYGKWKRCLFEEFENLLNWCSALHGKGMHINFIAHTQVKKFSNPEDADYDRYTIAMLVPDLAERLKQWSDNVLFMNYDTMFLDKPKKADATQKLKSKSLNRRLLYAKRTAAYDAGSRIGLPDVLELGDDPKAGFDLFWSYYDAWNAANTPKAELQAQAS